MFVLHLYVFLMKLFLFSETTFRADRELFSHSMFICFDNHKAISFKKPLEKAK